MEDKKKDINKNETVYYDNNCICFKDNGLKINPHINYHWYTLTFHERIYRPP